MLMCILLLSLAFFGINGTPTIIESNRSPNIKSCADDEYSRLKEEYGLCVAAPMVKYQINQVRGMNASICSMFEELFNHCVTIWSPCANETDIINLRETETQQIITALSAEGEEINYSNCSLFRQFNITKPIEEKLIFGNCNKTELSIAEKRSWACHNESIATMKRLIQLAGDKKEAAKTQFCDHMERSVVCESQLKKCLTTPEEWTEKKKFFLLGARKAVEEFQRIGFDLPECKVLEGGNLEP